MAAPSRVLRVRPLPPYPKMYGAITLVADVRTDGQFSIRMIFDSELTKHNPLDARSMTEPVFVDADAQRGFDRACEWLGRHFEILGERI